MNWEQLKVSSSNTADLGNSNLCGKSTALFLIHHEHVSLGEDDITAAHISNKCLYGNDRKNIEYEVFVTIHKRIMAMWDGAFLLK